MPITHVLTVQYMFVDCPRSLCVPALSQWFKSLPLVQHEPVPEGIPRMAVATAGPPMTGQIWLLSPGVRMSLLGCSVL